MKICLDESMIVTTLADVPTPRATSSATTTSSGSGVVLREASPLELGVARGVVEGVGGAGRRPVAQGEDHRPATGAAPRGAPPR